MDPNLILLDGRGVIWKSQIKHPLLTTIYPFHEDGCKAEKQRGHTLPTKMALGGQWCVW